MQAAESTPVRTARGRQHGFTLIELMVVVIILALVVGIAVPSLRYIVGNNRIKSATNALASSLLFARNEAIKRGVPISLCVSNTGTSCAGSSWSEGWIVFIDDGTAGSVDGSDEVLRIQDSLDAEVTVSTADVDTGDSPFVRMWPSGFRG